MMITGKQIRAARVLTDWDADDLAQRIGMSRVSVQNIERGDARPKPETLDKIIRAFSDVGIEFIENEGVRRRPEGLEIFEGIDRYQDFYNYMYNHLRQYGGEVCLNIYDESVLSRFRKNPEIHRDRMKELGKKGLISFRIITTLSDFVSQGYAEFRYVPNQVPTPTGFYAFGDCLALLSFVNKKSPYVLVIHSNAMTEAYRQGFNLVWDSADSKPSSVEKAIK